MKFNKHGQIFAVIIIFSSIAVFGLSIWVTMNTKMREETAKQRPKITELMDSFDAYVSNVMSDARESAMSVKKIYWLRDADIVAPEPNPQLFGTAQAGDMAGVLSEAAEILNGQSTVFNTEIQTFNDTAVRYYLDDTIFAVTWKQLFDNAVYTISEVKISHPSQLRRFFAGGEFASWQLHRTSDMAASVNAVVASSGDFYKFRPFGIVVYNGELCRFEGWALDTCYIDDNGDMLFSRQNELANPDAAREFIENNNVRFSVTFGPVLIEDGEITPMPNYYFLGEVYQFYPRAALAQMDELHYLLVVVNREGGYGLVPTIQMFASRLETFGCEKAYTMDGGQTAVIVMNDELINSVLYGYQRLVSDIIYFATAVPDGGD